MITGQSSRVGEELQLGRGVSGFTGAPGGRNESRMMAATSGPLSAMRIPNF
jgi:hypothetical protein